MNFFERQRQVRRSSRRLVLLFTLAVLSIIVVVDVVVVVTLGYYRLPLPQLLAIIAAISLAVGLLIGACSLVRTLLLRSGGGARVAEKLGGVYVSEDTTDPRLLRLRNVVEEISIASATPVPRLYVLPHEPGINAFAAGWSPSDAAVAVTRGALEQLNRDELQGVIAHEFSHVVNGDMRLNIKLMGTLFGILALAVVGRFLLWGGSGRRKSALPIVLIALTTLLAGYAGMFFGRLIKAAVSRQREYLADASAVQFTRQSAGLVGALKKIGGIPTGSKLRSGKVEDVSHMLFGDGMRLSSWFATHPPLPERIKVLDPSFDPRELHALSQRWSQAPPDGLAEDKALGLTAARDRPATPGPGPGAPSGPGAPPGPGPDAVRVRPDQVVASVATPAPDAFQHAAAILDSIPQPLLARARRPDTVVPLIFGLLLSTDPGARSVQHGVLADRYGQALADSAWREANTLAQLPPTQRLPLAEVAFSALRRRPAQELDSLVDGINAVISADGRTTVFEYCLSRLLHRELYQVNHRDAPRERRTSLRSAAEPVRILLSTLARVGHADPAKAEAAYRAGVTRLLGDFAPPYAPPSEGVTGLEPVWPALDGLADADKQRLVESLVTAIGHDGTVMVQEAELLRTVCGLLGVPLPPLTGPAAPDPAAPAARR